MVSSSSDTVVRSLQAATKLTGRNASAAPPSSTKLRGGRSGANTASSLASCASLPNGATSVQAISHCSVGLLISSALKAAGGTRSSWLKVEINTRALTQPGYSSASASASAPPNECPTNTG